MDNNCKDCVLLTALEERVDKMETKCIDHAQRIGCLESAVAVSDEKFKQVFQKLDEIIAILNKNSDRLPNVVWGIIGMVVGGLILWALKGF